MEALIICNDISKDKILIPKAKRVVPKQKHQKRKKIATNKAQKRKLEINELQKEKIINLDFITLDEINKDFNNLTDKLEEEICLDILKKNWSPALQMRSVLLSIQSLLNEPNTEDPLNEEVNAIWKSNKSKAESTAREWTKKYAK